MVPAGQVGPVSLQLGFANSRACVERSACAEPPFAWGARGAGSQGPPLPSVSLLSVPLLTLCLPQFRFVFRCKGALEGRHLKAASGSCGSVRCASVFAQTVRT